VNSATISAFTGPDIRRDIRRLCLSCRALRSFLSSATVSTFSKGTRHTGDLQAGPQWADKADICLGYIEGATDYPEWMRSDRNEKQCVPADVVLQQIENVVMVYLRDHPDFRTSLAAALVATAIAQAWNCDLGVNS
jgi:hypothetical protein